MELSCGKVDASPKPKITWSKSKILKKIVTKIVTHLIQLVRFKVPLIYLDSNRISQDEASSSSHSIFSNGYEAIEKYEEQTLGTSSNGELLIKNVNMKDQGWYKCEASNLLGNVDANMYLQVKST